MIIYENDNGFIKENEDKDFQVYKKTARNLDGWYDVSINHIATFYANGYVRDEFLGRMYQGTTDYKKRKTQAIAYLV